MSFSLESSGKVRSGILQSGISVKMDCKCSNPTDAVVSVRKHDCSELKRCEPCSGDRESTNNDHYTYTASLSLAGGRDQQTQIQASWSASLRSQHQTFASVSCTREPEQAVSRKASSWERASQISRRCLCCALCLPACCSVETAEGHFEEARKG